MNKANLVYNRYISLYVKIKISIPFMDILLKIDYREHAFIKNLSETHSNTINYAIENLPIGDFIIYSTHNMTQNVNVNKHENKHDTTQNMTQNENVNVNVNANATQNATQNTMELLYIIERKTISDLCSSITDARFREQKTRLLNSVKDPYKIIYIIEGSKKTARLSKKIMDSALLNLMFKHHYHVIFTIDINDTVDTVKLLYEKIKTNVIDTKLDFNNKISPLPSKLIKKSDSIQPNIFIHQLAVIPGVSIDIAQKISMIYPNMISLLNALKEDASILKDIHVTSKRKLGKKLSDKIYTSLCM